MNEAMELACAKAHELCDWGFECEYSYEAEEYFAEADRVLTEAGVTADQFQKWLKANI